MDEVLPFLDELRWPGMTFYFTSVLQVIDGKPNANGDIFILDSQGSSVQKMRDGVIVHDNVVY
jgi:hypothetical protein